MLRTFSIIFHWTCSLECWLLLPQTFLTSNKERVDDDPDANPYDDLRHYAYEVGFNFNKIQSLLSSNLSRHFPGWWQFRGLVIVAEFRHRWCRPWVWISSQLWTKVFQDQQARLFIEIVITRMAYLFIFLLPALLQNSHCAGSRNSPTCTAGSQIRTSLRLAAPLS